MTCFKCWTITIAGIMAMTAIVVAGTLHPHPVVAHWLGGISTAVLLVAVLADRTHSRTHT